MTATTDGSTGALPPRAASASETAPPTDTTIPAAAGVRDAAVRAAQRATDFLLSRQDAEGWWKGDLETNVTMDAEDLLLRQFLGIRDEATTQAAALFIRGEQREDGAWATLLRRPGRTLHHHRGVRGPAARRGRPGRPAHGEGLRLDPRAGRHRRGPGLHPDLAGAVRLVEVGRPARTPAGADLLPEVGTAQHLRLRLLGPADHRAADGRLREAPGAARALPARRAAHRPGRPQSAQAARARGQLGRRLPATRQGAARSTARSRRAGCARPR